MDSEAVTSRRKMTLMPNGQRTVLVDSGYFFALFNEKDQHHEEAIGKQGWLEDLLIVVPWPILYETVNTRLVRRPSDVEQFERILRKSELLDDFKYRKNVYVERDGRFEFRHKSISLVDSVICEILDDTNVPIDAILTFNSRDFQKICRVKDIEIL